MTPRHAAGTVSEILRSFSVPVPMWKKICIHILFTYRNVFLERNSDYQCCNQFQSLTSTL